MHKIIKYMLQTSSNSENIVLVLSEIVVAEHDG